VRSISVSVVQPHGRAAKNAALLPDYAVLGPAIRAARREADLHGIELLNPYCGLPLCVGWEDALDVSVEAVEARGGGWRGTPGIENVGDKRHGEMCRACVLRARCGGAWHAYWDTRAGSGLAAPATLGGPWAPGPFEGVVHVAGAPDSVAWDAVRARPEPFVWLHATAFGPADVAPLFDAGAGGVALELSGFGDSASLRGLHRLLKLRDVRPAQRRPAAWLALRDPDAGELRGMLELASALGVDGVQLIVADRAAWEPLVAALRVRWGVDVRV
jgi:hypothetical protein